MVSHNPSFSLLLYNTAVTTDLGLYRHIFRVHLKYTKIHTNLHKQTFTINVKKKILIFVLITAASTVYCTLFPIQYYDHYCVLIHC